MQGPKKKKKNKFREKWKKENDRMNVRYINKWEAIGGKYENEKNRKSRKIEGRLKVMKGKSNESHKQKLEKKTESKEAREDTLIWWWLEANNKKKENTKKSRRMVNK